jgi:hypothetical protein
VGRPGRRRTRGTAPSVHANSAIPYIRSLCWWGKDVMAVAAGAAGSPAS